MLGLEAISAIWASHQVGRPTSVPLDCPEFHWASAHVPYDEPGGPPRRYLVLSNGPENIADVYIPPGADHVNVYWGAIPFEGTDLRLRLDICNIFDLKAKMDRAEIRFCTGIRGVAAGAPTGVHIVRDVSTIGTGPAGPYEYIDPGKMQALAHLGQKWQTSMPPGATIDVPDESQAGDVAGLGVTMVKTETGRFGNLIAELDLKADHPMPGRALIVRTVLHVPGGGLGICKDETCCDSGAGERGWWPQADIEVESDRTRAVFVRPRAASPYFGFFRLCERGGRDGGMFNNLTPDKKAAKTDNPLDRFGTKNSGLWGVNVLYRVYYRAVGDVFTAFGSAIAGYLANAPAGQIVAGPFGEGDSPWRHYLDGSVDARFPGYVDRRSATDYDLADLGECGTADESVRYFECFIASVGASQYPTAWVITKR